MIQFNKTIFQFTKRFVLMVMLIGISNVVWSSQVTTYALVEVHATVDGIDKTAEGWVYLAEEKIANPSYTSNSTNAVTTAWNDRVKNGDYYDENPTYTRGRNVYWHSPYTDQEAILTESRTIKYYQATYWIWDQSDIKTKEFFLYAQNKGNDYLFLGWYNESDKRIEDSNPPTHSYTYDASVTKEPTNENTELLERVTFNGETDPNGTDPVQAYKKKFEPNLVATAKWVLPIVTKVDGQDGGKTHTVSRTILVTDPTLPTFTENVVFTLSQDQAKDNYTLTLINVTEDKSTYSKGSYTVPIEYTLQKKHGAEQLYVITLASNYDGGGTATFKTCSLTIKEQYTPEFEVINAKDEPVYSKVFTPQEGEQTQTLSDLFVSENSIAQHNTAKWSWEIIGDHKDYFSMTPTPAFNQSSKPENIAITFDRKNTTFSTYTAQLKITCTYPAVDGVETPTCTRYVDLTATFDPLIHFNGVVDYTLDLGTIICGNPVTKQVEHKFYNLGDSKPTVSKVSGEDEIVLTYDAINTPEQVTITMANTVLPGKYTAQWKSTATGAPNATLNVNAKVELATPILTAIPANAAVGLQWDAITGATKYYVTDSEPTFVLSDDGKYGTLTISGTKIAETTNAWYNHENLNNGTAYTYYVTVVHEKDGKVIDAKTSNVATATPANVVNEITWSNAEHTGLYTGTEAGGDNFPYKTKREINVRAAFDANGNAVMDRLYIFGLTTSKDAINYASAQTPCYVYEWKDEKTYRLLNRYNNVNLSDKLANFNITTHENLNDLYFTGFCPFATCGTAKWSDNAVMHIQGSGEVHVYIDNLQLYARSKNNAIYAIPATEIIGFGETNGNVTNGYSGGSGAIFAFSANSTTNFAPNIHIYNSDNENILDPTEGMQLAAGSDLTLTPSGPYRQYSSPIQILPRTIGTQEDNQVGTTPKVNLTIDDIWHDGTHTNGVLRLSGNRGGIGTGNDWSENYTTPSIDLGYADNTVNIAGGQLYFKQGQTSAMEYKTAEITGKVSSKTQKITLYGMHPSQVVTNTTATVRFLDGTINNAAGDANALVCPAKTTIDGGSFNCEIKAGNATEIYNSVGGKALKRLEITIPDKYIVNEKVTITDCNEFMDYIYPVVNYDNGTIYASLSEYYTNNNTSYGLASITPGSNNVAYMYLFCDGIPTINPWVVTGQDFNVTYTTGSGSRNVQVETTVHCTDQVNGKGANFGKTYNMLFVELDKYTARSEEDKYNTNYAGADAAIYTTETKSIQNTAEYSVSNKIYMMKPIVANDWMLFTAPFDVANVYVIEAYPERQLVTDFDGVRGVVHPNKVMDARKAQAERWLDLYMAWYNHGILSTEDFFGATDGTYSAFVNQWMTFESKKVKAEDGSYILADEANQAYRPKIVPLVHYNGNNAMDAHYYLYQSNGAWTFDGSNFTTSWTYVTNTEGVLMQKENVYALQFPHNTIGGKHNPDQSWDYWTGKYLLIESTTKTGEGEDVHIINGSDYKTDGLFNGSANPGSALLCGNASFAKLTGISSPDTNTSLWTLEKKANQNFNVEIKNEDGTPSSATITRDVHEFKEGIATLSPAEGMIVANFQAPQGMRARSINYRTGEVTYEKIDDNNTGDIETGLPTIMDDITLIVVPTEQGLTITPIKEQHVMLFDANGKMIFSKHLSAEENVTLPTGVYVVRGEYEQVKAIKK